LASRIGVRPSRRLRFRPLPVAPRGRLRYFIPVLAHSRQVHCDSLLHARLGFIHGTPCRNAAREVWHVGAIARSCGRNQYRVPGHSRSSVLQPRLFQYRLSCFGVELIGQMTGNRYLTRLHRMDVLAMAAFLILQYPSILTGNFSTSRIFIGYRFSGSSTHGGVASINRPSSGSTSSILHFISQAISR